MNLQPEIRYIDNDLLVCIKPFGMISEEGAKSIIPWLRSQAEAYDGAGEIYPVHRLDRETGGLMVYARTSAAAARLSLAIRSGEMQKTYLAEVSGIPNPSAGEMRDLLFHDRTKNKSYVVKRERKGVKSAHLTYSVVAAETESAVVMIRLLTGRTHQIRVQFSSRKHAVIGDRKYAGGKAEYLHLWSHRLTFPAADGSTLCFEAPAPFFDQNLYNRQNTDSE